MVFGALLAVAGGCGQEGETPAEPAGGPAGAPVAGPVLAEAGGETAAAESTVAAVRRALVAFHHTEGRYPAQAEGFLALHRRGLLNTAQYRWARDNLVYRLDGNRTSVTRRPEAAPKAPPQDATEAS